MFRESSNCKGFKLLWNVNLSEVLSAQRSWQGNLSETRIRRRSRDNRKNTAMSSWLLNTFKTNASDNKTSFPWLCANSICQYLGKTLPALHNQMWIVMYAVIYCYRMLSQEMCTPLGYMYNGILLIFNLYMFIYG